MRLFKLTSTKIDTVKARAKSVINSKQKYYFNIRHGMRGQDLFCYYFSVAAILGLPKNKSDVMEMIGDDYFLVPIRDLKTKAIKKDILDNTMYMVGRDSEYKDDGEILVLWNIPYTGYKDVKYEVSGDANVIACGVNGKERGDVIFSAPAPAIEIYGDCELKWMGKTMNGNREVEQIITYDILNDNFNIKPIKYKED